ncbi:MAG: hypothetical protein JNK25_00645 [Phycisphaerae bacterium]|nr:hypothetical protein [Phycisphaerae bacterium]
MTHTRHFSVLLAALALLVGCGRPVRPLLSPVGVVNPPGKAGLVLTGIVLGPDEPFVTSQTVMMRSQDSSGRDYDLLAGPYPKGAGEIGIGTHNSITTATFTGEAFVYASGYMPITRSKRVIAGATGTIYAMRISDSTNADLIIVLEAKSTLPVTCELLNPATGAPTGVRQKLGKGKYVKVSQSGAMPVFGPITNIPKAGDADPDGVLPFLEHVRSKAVSANLTTTAYFGSLANLPNPSTP